MKQSKRSKRYRKQIDVKEDDYEENHSQNNADHVMTKHRVISHYHNPSFNHHQNARSESKDNINAKRHYSTQQPRSHRHHHHHHHHLRKASTQHDHAHHHHHHRYDVNNNNNNNDNNNNDNNNNNNDNNKNNNILTSKATVEEAKPSKHAKKVQKETFHRSVKQPKREQHTVNSHRSQHASSQDETRGEHISHSPEELCQPHVQVISSSLSNIKEINIDNKTDETNNEPHTERVKLRKKHEKRNTPRNSDGKIRKRLPPLAFPEYNISSAEKRLSLQEPKSARTKKVHRSTTLYWEELPKGHTSADNIIYAVGKEAQIQSRYTETIIHSASTNGQLDIVKFYVEKNKYLNEQNGYLNTALHCATFHKHLDIIDVLLESEAEMNLQNVEGDTVLHLAVDKELTEVVRRFLERGCNVNLQNENGETPLHIAVHRKNVDVVKLLLQNGADMTITNHHGNTALHSSVHFFALMETINTLVDALTKQEKEKHGCTHDEEYSSTQNKEIDFFDETDGCRNANLNFQVEDTNMIERPVLTIEDDKEIVHKHSGEQQIKNKNEEELNMINLTNASGDTVLHRAAKYCTSEIIESILQSEQIDLLQKNKKGNTALHCAATLPNVETVKLLVNRDKRLLDVTNGLGNTALHCAIERGHVETVQFLLGSAARSDIKNYAGNTAVHAAILNEQHTILNVLFQHDARLDAANCENELPIHTAFKKRNVDIFKCVLGKSKNYINDFYNQDGTLLHMTFKNTFTADKNDVFLEMLIHNFADVNIQDNDGNTPLHLAIKKRRKKASELLVMVDGVNLEVRNNEGHTALHLLAQFNEIDLFSKMRITKKELDVTNNNGETALNIAIRHNYSDLSILLLKIAWDLDFSL
ncbi:putative ankyrin repeat protein RF_0381 [Hydractinia symbiolongicarpus]|uniref:putative ankyrin repeat protein RF_0381 n=1 Tax=Hydractinia symbiolongicarpus TaxID=13093 RepID=UPI00254C1EBA|nr:putative ankyrin repeat protein RF_0381 [Hydractinia symbiolongicarpus]